MSSDLEIIALVSCYGQFGAGKVAMLDGGSGAG